MDDDCLPMVASTGTISGYKSSVKFSYEAVLKVS